MDWPLPRLLYQGLPGLSCVDRTSSVFGSVSRGGGLQPTACHHMCQKMSQTQIWPRGSRVTLSDRSICLRQTDGQAPAPSVSTVTSCHQRSGRLTDRAAGEASNPIPIPDIATPPAPLISLHPGIEWPYKNVQRERQIQETGETLSGWRSFNTLPRPLCT